VALTRLGTCARVVDMPQARALGVPNSVLGALWYVAVLGWQLRRGCWGMRCWGLRCSQRRDGGFSAWLSWALVVRLRELCQLCFLAHGVYSGCGDCGDDGGHGVGRPFSRKLDAARSGIAGVGPT
jgi:uncharacterized membrane protein